MTNTLQCPNCGSTDFIQSGQSHVCKRCGTINRFSALDDGVKLSLSAAFLDRQRGRFADARAVYETVLKTDPDCHEAWFGLFLCDYSVLFETDGDGEKNPSFYGVKKTPVWESVPLKKALKLAGGETAAFDGYKAQADKIEYARAAFQRIAAVTPPWDVFICFKKTARDGGDTQDYILAQQLYAKLSQKYRVFYSDASLDALERREFEPNIYYALYTAKAMVLVCSEKEYVEAQWVKNEWSRYLALNGGGGLLPVFTAGCDIHDLPPEIRRLHGFSVRELDFYAKLERAADALVFSEKRKAEREEKAAAERAAREREWRERERALLEKVKSETAGGPNLSGMAARARMELRDGNPGKCADLCDKMLNTDPTCAEAWWLSFLTEKNLAGEEELPHLDETVWPQSREVRKALEFADEQQRGVYANYIEAWIGRRIAAAAQYKDAGKYWKAKRALMIPADIVEKYGGGKRFDFFYNALLLELSGGPDGETVCFGAVEELELYARAERYADERQKGDLRATAEAARGRVEQYLRRAADKRGAIERAAAECEAEVLSVKASVNAEKNKNADAMRDLDDKRRAMRERHARENRNCAERINRAAAEKANYTAARNDRKKLNRLFAASVAVGIVFYAVLFVAVIALVSEKAGNPYLPLYLTGALGAGLFLGWVGGRVSERIKAWKNKGFIFLCIRCVAGLFYLIGKYALLVPFGIVYAKGRYDRATAARLKKYDEEIRTAQDTRDRSAARQRGQAADLDAQITALAVFKGKAVKRLTELDGILAGLRQNAPIGFRDGIVSAAEAERRLQACDEHLTGIKNVRAYVAKMKNGGQVGNR